MNKPQRVRYEALAKVSQFGAANKELFPSESIGGQSFSAVAGAVAALEQHLTSRVVARAEARRVKAATRATLFEYMKKIAKAARRITAKEPMNPFRIPRYRSATVLVSTARAFIAEAEKRQDDFVRRGLPPTFIADFRSLVDGLEQAVETRWTGATGRRQANAGIEASLKAGLDALQELDVA